MEKYIIKKVLTEGLNLPKKKSYSIVDSCNWINDIFNKVENELKWVQCYIFRDCPNSMELLVFVGEYTVAFIWEATYPNQIKIYKQDQDSHDDSEYVNEFIVDFNDLETATKRIEAVIYIYDRYTNPSPEQLNEGLNFVKSDKREEYFQLDQYGLRKVGPLNMEEVNFTEPWEKVIYDKSGHMIYRETYGGYWQKWKYNSDGVLISYGDADHSGGPLQEGLNLPKRKSYWENEELVARSFIYVSEWYRDKNPIKSKTDNWGVYSIKIPDWYLDYQLKLSWNEELWEMIEITVLDSNDEIQMSESLIIPRNILLTDFLQLIGNSDRQLKDKFAQTLELETDEELIQEGLNLVKRSRKYMVFQFLDDNAKIYDADVLVYDDQPRYFISFDSFGENGFFIEKLNEQNLAHRLESEKSGWSTNSTIKDGYVVTSWHVGAQKAITDYLNLRSSELVDQYGIITDFHLASEINEWILDWFLQNNTMNLNEGLNLPKRNMSAEVKGRFDAIASWFGVDRTIEEKVDAANRHMIQCNFSLYGNEQSGYIFVELFYIPQSDKIYGSMGLRDNYPDSMYIISGLLSDDIGLLIDDIERRKNTILSFF